MFEKSMKEPSSPGCYFSFSGVKNNNNYYYNFLFSSFFFFKCG